MGDVEDGERVQIIDARIRVIAIRVRDDLRAQAARAAKEGIQVIEAHKRCRRT